MDYMHLYTGPDGNSHFKKEEIDLKHAWKQGRISSTMKVRGVQFYTTDPDYSYDFHNAPHKQFIINLEGAVDITASDGTKMRFGPGDVFLADDTTGRGHISHAVDNKPRKVMVVIVE